MVEMEVDSLPMIFLLNVYNLLGCVVFQNHLLKEQECTFVVYSLSYLNLTLPNVWRVCSLAIITLQV